MLGRRSWCPHCPCSGGRHWATLWSRRVVVGILAGPHSMPRRPRLVTRGTDPETGLGRDVRQAPEKSTFGVCPLQPRPRRRDSSGRKRQGEAGSLLDPPGHGAASTQEPKEVAQAPPVSRDYCLGGSHPFPHPGPPHSWLAVTQTRGYRGGSAARSARGPPEPPPPHSQGTSRRARRTLEESAARGN